jgi:hypothetical protein
LRELQNPEEDDEENDGRASYNPMMIESRRERETDSHERCLLFDSEDTDE